jgi:hypothetical protein
MEHKTHNSQIDVRRPGQMLVVCTGRRVWSLNFQ